MITEPTPKTYILATISDVMEERMGIKPKPGQKLHDDLGMDSLDTAELGMELEKEFDITIPDEEYDRFWKMSVEEVVDYIHGLILAKKAA